MRNQEITIMDKYRNEFSAAKGFAEAIKDVFENSKIYLFGSFAKGSPHEMSDIDVGIIVDDLRRYPINEYIKKDMHISAKTLDFDLRISPHIVGRKQDVTGFLQEIETTGIRLV